MARVWHRVVVALGLSAGVGVAAAPARAQFTEYFQGHTGSVCGYHGWDQWIGSQDVCGEVSREQHLSGFKSLKIVGNPGGANGQGDDTVQRFQNIVGGRWTFSIMTFVPGNATGEAAIILLNTYDDPPGAPISTYKWSLQVHLDADRQLAHADFDNQALPLIRDQWVEFRAEIDLDADRVDYFYAGQQFVSGKSWINGVSTGGVPRIEALDLYGGEPTTGGTTGTYFDDISLRPAGLDRVVYGVVEQQPRPKAYIGLAGANGQFYELISVEYDRCPCDWNRDGTMNSQDFFDFLQSLFAANADFNRDGVTNSQDFFDFLICFLSGCRAGEDFTSMRLAGYSEQELLQHQSQGVDPWLLAHLLTRQAENLWWTGFPDFHGSTTDLGVLTRLSECLDNASDMTAAAALGGGWVADGCTNVPDFDFKSCCDAHDACYCAGGTEADRQACDDELYRCIRYDFGHRWLAAIYYAGVRAFGGSHFNYHP